MHPHVVCQGAVSALRLCAFLCCLSALASLLPFSPRPSSELTLHRVDRKACLPPLFVVAGWMQSSCQVVHLVPVQVFSFSANALPDDITIMTMAGERVRSGPPDDVKQ